MALTGMAALLSIRIGCLAQNAEADAPTFSPSGVYVRFLTEQTGNLRMQVDPTGQYFAWFDRFRGNLEVWKAGDDGLPQTQLLDTGDDEFHVRSVQWTRRGLCIARVHGPEEVLERWRDGSQEENWEELEYELLLWEPETGVTTTLSNDPVLALRSADDHRRLVTLDTMDVRDPIRVTVYSLADGGVPVSWTLDISDDFTDYVVPVLVSPDGRRLLLLAAAEGRMPRSGETMFPLLVIAGEDVEPTRLTDMQQLSVWGGVSGRSSFTAWSVRGGVLDPVPVRDGRATATTVISHHRDVAIGIFDFSGLIDLYTLGVRWPMPHTKMGLTAERLQAIAVDPAGRRLIVQETLGDQYEPAWVFSVDLVTLATTPIARMPMISELYGWVGDDGLVMKTPGRILGEGHLTWGTEDFGILRLTREADQGG
jgi:hypothetical protein